MYNVIEWGSQLAEPTIEALKMKPIAETLVVDQDIQKVVNVVLDTFKGNDANFIVSPEMSSLFAVMKSAVIKFAVMKIGFNIVSVIFAIIIVILLGIEWFNKKRTIGSDE